jgi:hypothetical protein
VGIERGKVMQKQAVLPPRIRKSVYGPQLRQRAATLSGIISLPVREIFPDIPQEIYSYSKGNEISVIRKATENALAGVDMSMIRIRDTVNILSDEHGYFIAGGEPYSEMIRTIKDVVQERTGCKNIRLRVAGRLKETNEIFRDFKLTQYFNGQTARLNPFDKGVPIETEIGTLYGVARAYDADWFIHAHYSDLRELYWHRLIDRTLKPFAMGYARFETRGVTHFNFGPRSSNFVPRAIFNSPFIQKKYSFTSILMVAPSGIIGVDADNDLNQVNRRQTVIVLKSFGKLTRLFAQIDECIAVMDAGKWPMYLHAGGIPFGVMVNATVDYFDLNTIPAGSGFALFERAPGVPKVKVINPAIKVLVFNYMWISMTNTELVKAIPSIVVGRDLADMCITDSSNPRMMDYSVTAENLESALEFARRIGKTDKIILFDASFGNINLSQSLADFMLNNASEVSRKVDEELLPKWLRQRGFDPQLS